MSLRDRWRAAWHAWNHPYGDQVNSITDQALKDGALPADFRERVAILRSYYESTAYARLGDAANRRGVGGLKLIDNPAYQSVEFYPAHLFPGSLSEALPIRLPQDETPEPEPGTQEELEVVPEQPGEPDTGEALRGAIRQVWIWSRWESEKQVYARWLARDGEAWLQAATREDESGTVTRSYIQMIDVMNVSEFEEDERGNLTWLRLDVPLEDDDGQVWWHTEVWDKAEDLHRVWIHRLGPDADLEALGDPNPLSESGRDPETGQLVLEETGEVDETITSLGFDFVPYVRVPFIDDGGERGIGVYQKFLIPIDEINRAVNRLHDTYFAYDRPRMVLKRNESGKPPVDLRPDVDEDEDGEADEVRVGDEIMYRLPGNASLESMIPTIPYEWGIELIEKRVQRLSESLAEIRFFQDVDQGDPSGISRRLRLAPAVSRAKEARTNAEAGLIRATQMCLTLGALNGLFDGIGTYEDGDFDFEIEPREILHVSDLERFEQELKEVEILARYKDLPPALFRRYLEARGYDDAVIEAAVGQATTASQPAPRLAGLLED